MLARIVIFLLQILKIFAFNVDTSSPIKFSDNNPKGLFGHDLALDENKLFVGAPKADKHGNLFICSFDGKSSQLQNKNCQKMRIERYVLKFKNICKRHKLKKYKAERCKAAMKGINT